MTQRANPKDVLAIFAKHYKKFRDLKNFPILERLVLLIIGREMDSSAAEKSLENLKSDFVDWNEMRLGRIDDIKTAMKEMGAPDSDLRALHLREMLGKVFTERHMLDAEFLRTEDKEKRAAFLAGLPGLDFAQCQALEASILGEADDVPFSLQVQRVCQRLGWIPKGSSVAVTKAKKMLFEFSEGDTVNITYGLARVGEEVCHTHNPECARCLLHGVCPTGKQILSGKHHADSSHEKQSSHEK
jgi:endonuclease III